MYTIKEFLSDYPTDESCLAEILSRKYSNWVCSCGRSKLYKVKNRPVYACACGKQVNPLSGTIFQGTKLPLRDWFYVMYVMSQSKNGVSAASIQRHLGVKWDSAWRMAMKVRELMVDDAPLAGEIEMDEAYIRAKPWRTTRRMPYGGRARIIIGMVERGGRAKAVVVSDTSLDTIFDLINQNIPKGTPIYTDAHHMYRLSTVFHKHEYVNHSKGEWVRDNVHTQNVENLWSGLKLTLQGTYKGVTPQYLQNYANERAWVWSQRENEPFEALLSHL